MTFDYYKNINEETVRGNQIIHHSYNTNVYREKRKGEKDRERREDIRREGRWWAMGVE